MVTRMSEGLDSVRQSIVVKAEGSLTKPQLNPESFPLIYSRGIWRSYPKGGTRGGSGQQRLLKLTGMIVLTTMPKGLVTMFRDDPNKGVVVSKERGVEGLGNWSEMLFERRGRSCTDVDTRSSSNSVG